MLIMYNVQVYINRVLTDGILQLSTIVVVALVIFYYFQCFADNHVDVGVYTPMFELLISLKVNLDCTVIIYFFYLFIVDAIIRINIKGRLVGNNLFRTHEYNNSIYIYTNINNNNYTHSLFLKAIIDG